MADDEPDYVTGISAVLQDSGVTVFEAFDGESGLQTARGERPDLVRLGISMTCKHCPVERTLRDGESHRSEKLVEMLQGYEVRVIAYTTPIRNAPGEIAPVMQMSAGITGIKLLHKHLRESQERHRLLFEEIAQSHGGTIREESQEGAGSEFGVVLPRLSPPIPRPPVESAPSQDHRQR